MLNAIILWSIKNRWLVSLLGLVLLVYGLFAAARTPVDVFPDFAPVQVVVQTEAPGYAPEEVEGVITLPLENMLNGTANVETVRSISTVGLSVITLIFEDGTDVFTARQLVTEKLQSVQADLPNEVEPPRLAPIRTAVGDVMRLGLVVDKTSPMELRTLADWTILPRVMAIPGVSNVVIHGGEVKQYQVLVDPEKLDNYRVTLDQVVHAAAESNVNAPGGILRTRDEEFLIRGLGRVETVEDIASQAITSRDGVPILIGTVADVKIGPAFKIGDALVNGKPGVILTITKQPWANTLLTTYRIEEVLENLQASFPEDIEIIPTFRQADFIEVAIHNVLEAIVLGGILVVVILFLFLRNWRTSFITITAIPLSLLAAIIALKWQGSTINTMTLGGLAIAIGEVVDDAIIDVENVYRRLRENKLAGSPRHPLRVVYDASREIRSSVVYATFIVALVFLPVLSLGGLEGKIFTPLAFSYIVAILASLGVALTITPAMCYLLLSNQAHLPEQETPSVLWLKERYQRILRFGLERPKQVCLAAGGLFLVSLLPLFFLGRSFLPEFDESNLVVAANAIPGTSLEVTTQSGQFLTGHLMQHQEVLAIGQRAGRAEGSDDYGGSNFSEYDIRLKPRGIHREDVIHHVRDDFSRVPGLVINLGSYISHRMDHVLSGVNAAVAIKVYGPELPILHRKAQEIESVMREVPGAVDVQVEPIIPIPQISIVVDRQAAARYGLTAGDLARTIETAYKGITVSRVLEGQRTFDLFVWFDPQYRHDVGIIESTLIDTPAGIKVPIGSVAGVRQETSPNMIRHEQASRNVVIQANVADRDLGSVIREMRRKIGEQITLPPGYYVVYGGQFEAQEKAARQLLMLSLVAIGAIFVLLLMAFRSVKAALLVMVNLPLALIGGIWAIVISGGVLSIGSLVGFITLFGISTRNGIMLVSHFNHLLGEGKSFDEILWTGSLDRLSPVLMTALTAALGVLPIALMGGAGRELEQPLAVVILGGMFSSTALTLVVVPALFKLFGRKALNPQQLDSDSDEEHSL